MRFTAESAESAERAEMDLNELTEQVIVELKAVAHIEPIHEAQVLSYLRLSGCRVGLLVNFHVKQLTKGVRRLVNEFPESPSAFSTPSAVSAVSLRDVGMPA